MISYWLGFSEGMEDINSIIGFIGWDYRNRSGRVHTDHCTGKREDPLISQSKRLEAREQKSARV